MGDLKDKNKKKKKLPGNLYDPRLRYDYENREIGTVSPDNTREPFRWVSDVAYKNVHRIVARGYDTTELVEAGYGFADMIFIDFQARIPLIEEQKMLNYIMVLGLEDGLSSPAAMARIVAGSNVYLTQAAGASILAFGHAYGAYSAFGNMLLRYQSMVEEGTKSEQQAAKQLVQENVDKDYLGVSELYLKDPSPGRIIARAEKLNVARKYIPFMKKVVEEAKKVFQKPVCLDMLGAVGAAMLDLGFTPESSWAIMAVTRGYAAGAHYCEEIEREGFARMGEALTPKEAYDGPDEKPVPSTEKRSRTAKPYKSETLDE
ncbi:MAG: hypothetical protein ACOC7U_08905, partial [Spirochaetota bacterium]